MKVKKTIDDYIVDIFCYTFLIILCITIIIPFLQIITISLSPIKYVNSFGLKLFPKEIVFDGYINIFKNNQLWIGYKNTIFVTVVGTFFNVLITCIGAYALSKKDLPGRNYLTAFIVFTMYFGGGTIPTYLMMRQLHLVDNMAVYILPGIISSYNMIITRNFFMSLPNSLEESARVDGAGLLRIFFVIILPLSKPIIATISLWYGVAHWNEWRASLIYVPDSEKHLLQYVLRQILFEGTLKEESLVEDVREVIVNTETMKNAALLIATIPILCVYPFVQKYFVKGVMVGSLKG
ncbi:carbohydrate ABC transporter permease [Vallitalea okinawensis]|uniref:carbohydrate ABC transporter permease n=1 Tax=Vallitalea okinawensis TaxID=2078660 RepID=UPI000CFCBB33|nr:carbohydrate ABC transporter permease [Vallitalea okinawensis]